MNNIKKAINLIKNNKQEYEELLAENTNKGANAGIVEIIKTYDIAISALEKQTSKKFELVFSPNGHKIYFCPSCQENVNKDDWYCSQCGQKLDWEV